MQTFTYKKTGFENLSYSKVYGFTVDKDVHIYAGFSRTAVA